MHLKPADETALGQFLALVGGQLPGTEVRRYVQGFKGLPNQSQDFLKAAACIVLCDFSIFDQKF